MKHLFITLLMAAASMMPAISFSQTTYVDNGTSTNYNLQSGDSLYIRQNTFTGSVTNWSGGAKITVASGATFRPSAVNGYRSRYIIHGTMIVSSISAETGFSLTNNGTVTVNGNTAMNASGQTWINNASAVMNFNGGVAVNSAGNTITNYADINITGEFNLYGNSTINNRRNIVIGGNFNSSTGQVNNQGRFESQRTITFGGSTVVTNSCRTIGNNGININNNNASVYNNGLLLSARGTSFTNSGSIFNSGNGVIKSGAFINYRTVSGSGFLYITGRSTLGGGASVGSNPTSADSLKIYTVNRTNNAQIFDDQWGTVHPNAKYAQFAAPDTTGFVNYSCSSEYMALTILPTTWIDFSVKIANNLPVINWSADFEEGTLFIVQRSNNGVDFTAVTNVAGKNNTSSYSFIDNSISLTHGSVIYYRVCAVEPKGVQKYTAVKNIKLNSNEGASKFSASPNPFGNQLSIAYSAKQKQSLVLRIFNVNGQVVYSKSLIVNAGNNTIAVAETSKWLSGIYIVQLIDQNGIAVSMKIVKQ